MLDFMQPNRIKEFRKVVWAYYRKEGRHELPWRATKDPYKILVSEVMLQQTQAERVIPYYKAWIKKFPTAMALAEASLAEVLIAWQGLGYNRRAKNLHATAKILIHGRHPMSTMDVRELEKLPGVGPYTARAVLAFAHNEDVVFVETNIRTAIIHTFFQNNKKRNDTICGIISDTEIEHVLARVLPTGRAREWYGALMDYGAYLKRSGVRLNAKAKNHTKQSKFKGSSREARGVLLKELAKRPAIKRHLCALLGDSRVPQLQIQLDTLIREGMLEKAGRSYQLPL